METKPKVTQKCMLCTFVSFIGCFIFLLCQHDNEVGHFRAIRNAMFNVASSLDDSFSPSENLEISKPARSREDEGGIIQKNSKNKCNIFEGRWVYNPMESRYYEAPQCPFLSEQVSCQKNGRPDFDYENWSWEGHDCVIPSFNGRDMLKRLRGKRIIIVGDSLNRNQWESLACLLYSTIPPSRAHLDYSSGSYKVFKAKDYNVTVEFYWDPFLVQFDSNNAGAPKILRLETIDLLSRHWQGADIMVFNTGHWWVHLGKFKRWDLFEYKGQLIDELKLELAFEVAMRTWANWIDQNVNLTKTTVFFRSISPEHKTQNGCYNKTQPITDTSHVSHFSESLTEIVDKTLSKMRVPVRYLNITKLSEHRLDAHPSVYNKMKGQELMNRKLKPPESYADCSHWCLPGLPDTWNRYCVEDNKVPRPAINLIEEMKMEEEMKVEEMRETLSSNCQIDREVVPKLASKFCDQNSVIQQVKRISVGLGQNIGPSSESAQVHSQPNLTHAHNKPIFNSADDIRTNDQMHRSQNMLF